MWCNIHIINSVWNHFVGIPLPSFIHSICGYTLYGFYAVPDLAAVAFTTEADTMHYGEAAHRNSLSLYIYIECGTAATAVQTRNI